MKQYDDSEDKTMIVFTTSKSTLKAIVSYFKMSLAMFELHVKSLAQIQDMLTQTDLIRTLRGKPY